VEQNVLASQCTRPHILSNGRRLYALAAEIMAKDFVSRSDA